MVEGPVMLGLGGRGTGTKFFNLRLARQILSLEIRKVLSYRVDFWIQFIGGVLAELGVAYFLWRAIFSYRGVDEMGGYTFSAMMLYYVLTPLMSRVIRAQEMDFLAREIYEGTLTRYLIYPLSFFFYKYLAHLSTALVAVLQTVVGVLIYLGLFGVPRGVDLHLGNMALGMAVCLLGTVLYFYIAVCIEMVAFWQDNVWSLMVMLRFLIRFLGGAMIPLALFPGWAQVVLYGMPFVYVTAFPVQIFMGKTAGSEILLGMVVMAAWSIGAFLLARWIRKRGLLQYTGVGI